MFGSVVGITARSQNWLGSVGPQIDVQAAIQRWTAVGLNKEDIAQRLFDREYPPIKETSNVSGQAVGTSVLMGEKQKECDRLLGFLSEQLSEELQQSSIGIFKDLPTIIQDPDITKQVIEAQCKKLGQ